jgi:hypothetical protein
MDILRFRLEFKSIIQNTSKLYGKLYSHSKNKRPRKKPAATDTANKIHKRSKPTHKTNKLATTTTKPLSKKIEHHLSSQPLEIKSSMINLQFPFPTLPLTMNSRIIPQILFSQNSHREKLTKKNSPQQQKKQPTVHPTTNSQTLPRIPMNTQNGNQLKDHHSDISIYSIASSDDE